MATDIPKVYNPENVEERLYDQWQQKGLFEAHPEPESGKRKYCIVIPPPNVTDVLHMGHAYNNTIQDVLIRFHRMLGDNTLWIPGTDHAGIATQNVVERRLAKEEGITRHQLGREEFVKRVWQWREKYGDMIINQLKRLGCSCDWSRTRFTMDETLSRAVTEIFVRLYEKGLIYRDKYIINWCPRCQTAISDEEVDHHEEEGSLVYIRYPISNEKTSKQYIVVATTRPESMLGDTGIAVHPDDFRFKKFIGKEAILPVMNRKIPIVADEYVDPKFGTGAVKITPAHDPNDFDMGQRHHLPVVTVINEDGKMNDSAGKYSGMDRFKCRKELLEELRKLNLLEKKEKHKHAVGHCQRCNTIIEPYLSEQWFVKIKPLAEPALQVVRDGKIKFIPGKWTRIYEDWMENIRDWCISRQLWWGHRIPVYYCNDCQEMMVMRQRPQQCTNCDSEDISQDSDVLDTWFSSWLWPFSTMGWPEKTKDLKYFYPTDALITGPDIIFFWVARMIMAGLEFMKEVPFSYVYINGIIRDEIGRKMSKSLGNGIDPLEMIRKFSADSVRFSLLALTSEGQDVNLSESKFEMGRNFSNKIWNAFRFLAINRENGTVDPEFSLSADSDSDHYELADRWILSRYNRTIEKAKQALDSFKFNEYVNLIYSFFWHDFCDWYLELIKSRLYKTDDPSQKQLVLNLGYFILKGAMQMLHPVMPFITEEIWQQIRNEKDSENIMVSLWPGADQNLIHSDIEEDMNIMQEIVGAIRNIRGEMNIMPGKKADVYINLENTQKEELIRKHQSYLTQLAAVANCEIGSEIKKPKNSASAVVGDVELYMPLKGLIDIETERDRLQKEVDRLEDQLEKLNLKLSDQNFLDRAPKEVVEKQRQKKANFEEKLEKLNSNLNTLSN